VEVARTSPATGAGTRLIAGVALLGVLALTALIVRELIPHHGVAPSPRGVIEERSLPPEPIATAAPLATPRAVPTASAGAPARPAPTMNAVGDPSAPLAANVIAQVAKDPEAFAPTTAFSPVSSKTQLYNFDPLPPFNSTTLRRVKANPAAWELDAMRGPKLKDLGPEGSVRQAAIVKDTVGNETTWYRIDSGPLAPAYAVEVGRSIRVMSKDYIAANREDMPPEIAATLDR
jgi:hypothetical protein